MRKPREYLDKKTSILLYKSLLLPYIDYYDTVYMVTNATDLKQLQLIQNAACRTLSLADRDTNAEYMHSEHKFLRLDDRRNLQFLIECHKNVYNKGSSMSKYFVQESELRM